MSNKAAQRITEDDYAIIKALEDPDAHAPSLMMAMVHLTGDTDILHGPIRPDINEIDVQGGLSSEQQAEIRELALKTLKVYRERGCTLPPPLSPETKLEMMSFLIGEPVPEEYEPLLKEEMGIDAKEDEHTLDWLKSLPEDVKSGFKVVIIGAGMSGLLAAISLEEAGIPYVVIEKNGEVGGTWYENTYPGCRCDVPNHFYSYSFDDHDWSHHFSTQPEILAYFKRCADKYGVRRNIRFNTEVASATYDAETARWTVKTRAADGDEQELVANAVISAVGQLNRPSVPAIKGAETFRGISFHSAAWEHEHDLTGKRVAVVGTGASAMQFVPEVAKQAGELFIFQRNAPWTLPTPRYRTSLGEGHRWLMQHVPYYSNWYRFWLLGQADAKLEGMKLDLSWDKLDRSANARGDKIRVAIEQFITDQVGDNPELLEKAIPQYPYGANRRLLDDGAWIRTLRRDDVHVVTDRIAAITPAGVVTETGDEYAVDALIYGTGFKAGQFLWPMEVQGEDGMRLDEHWGEDGPRAYRGTTIPGFPNLFVLYGPNTNLSHSGSIIFMAECQMRYVLGCFKLLLESGSAAMAPKRDIHDVYNKEIDDANARRIWGIADYSTGWYKNDKGRVVASWPFRLIEFWRATRMPAPSDYEFISPRVRTTSL